MKSKVFGKKLTLNKKTVADLNMGKMKKVYAGGEIPESQELTACTCLYTGGCCPTENCTECTCGTGNPLCACVSRLDK